MADIFYTMDYEKSDGTQIPAFPILDLNAGHSFRPDTAHKTNIVTAQTVLHLIERSKEMIVGMAPSRPESDDLLHAFSHSEKLKQIMITAFAKDFMRRLTTPQQALEVAQRREILPPVQI